MTLEEREIEDLIRKSDVGKYLVKARADPNRDDNWAKFRSPNGLFFTVQAESDTDSSPDSVATDLIAQARAKIPN